MLWMIDYVCSVFGNAWKAASSFVLGRHFIQHCRAQIDIADDSVKSELESLIDGGTFEKPVHEDITYGEVYESMDNLWNLKPQRR